MKTNVTISMDDADLAEIRVEAAKRGASVSKFIADVLRREVRGPTMSRAADRTSQIEALERILSGPKWDVMRDGRMPTADERNER